MEMDLEYNSTQKISSLGDMIVQHRVESRCGNSNRREGTLNFVKIEVLQISPYLLVFLFIES